MSWIRITASLGVWAALALPVQAASSTYVVRQAAWSAADEREYGAFITAIGASNCRTVDACLTSRANIFAGRNPGGAQFRSDCADLPYVLRFYYAWARGLPFSYAADVSPRSRARDVRYSASGNRIEERRDVTTGADLFSVLNRLRDAVSTATYRVHPALEEPVESDFYSPAIDPRAIRPGTVIYDPNGHLAVIWKIEANGRLHYIDAHPDNSLTRGVYDLRFVRASPGMGAGFKNWRPLRLEGARRDGSGALIGGRSVLARNAQIADFSLVQYFGSGGVTADSNWKAGDFYLNGQRLDYYDYVRARLAGDRLRFNPLTEIAEMVASNCADLSYRADAVRVALERGLQNQAQPTRLPFNIYGTEGDWEDYSTPSRDARLKTAFKEVRDTAQRFLEMGAAADPRLAYAGYDLAGDMLRAYTQAAAACTVRYQRSDGSLISLGYEEARARLFALSFDPYHCPERRWGAQGAELATCRDGASKQAWYRAEQPLRNQIERTYEARMDWSLAELERGNGDIGASQPPDTDTRSFLLAQMAQRKTGARNPDARFP